MYYSVRSLFFSLTNWTEGWRRRLRAMGRTKEQASGRERLYQERLLRMEREYVRQAMEAYARRKR